MPTNVDAAAHRIEIAKRLQESGRSTEAVALVVDQIIVAACRAERTMVVAALRHQALLAIAHGARGAFSIPLDQAADMIERGEHVT